MINNQNSPVDFKAIRRLHIKTLRDVEDCFAGIYRSVFKGKGIEFEDVREYQPGDDIRTIDWNVTARSKQPFVKNFREERQLTVMLVVDVSASSHFSHTHKLKCEMIAEMAALLAFSAIKNQDKVGLLLFSDGIELYLPPKKGVRHVLRVIRELLYFKPKMKGTNFSNALQFLGQLHKQRMICFLISDFLTTDFQTHLSVSAKKHDLIAFQIYDDYEKVFKPRGLFHLKDLETLEDVIVDTADITVQRLFTEKALKSQEEIEKIFDRFGVDFVSISTSQSVSDELQHFFRRRKKR